MTDQTSSDDRRGDVKTERDHPQTRKGEPDARGTSQWRDDVEPREDERQREDDEKSVTVSELAVAGEVQAAIARASPWPELRRSGPRREPAETQRFPDQLSRRASITVTSRLPCHSSHLRP